MIGIMSEPTAVYLVEDHTDLEPTPYTKYFAHVYLSRASATAGVEYWAAHGGHGALRWIDRAGVSYAYPATGSRTKELYKVVPLRVHPDNQPER